MKNRKRLIVAGLTALLGLSACGSEEDSAPAGRGGRGGPGGWGGGKPGGRAAIPVKAEVAHRTDMVAYIETHARLEAERRVVVVSRSTGLVEELLVEEGDRVRQGDILARLDKSETALRVEQVKVNLDQARTSFKRNQALYQRNMVSEADFESVRNQVDNLQVQLREAQLNLEYADIRSPIDGMVMARHIELGDMARGNGELFAVADLDPLITRIYIPERRMRQIAAGQEAQISIDALPDSNFKAQIRMISPGVDPQSGTVKITLEVPKGDGTLRPGMFATVRIITERRRGTLAIPKKALILETDEDDAFVVREGKAQRIPLVLGLVQGDLVEVLEGLVEGEQVVTVGQEGLKDGTQIRLIGAGQTVEEGEAGGQGEGSGQGEAGGRGKRGGGSWGTKGSGRIDGVAKDDSAKGQPDRQSGSWKAKGAEREQATPGAGATRPQKGQAAGGEKPVTPAKPATGS
jgi:membrane fusion protein, multidrug efflux system